MSSEEQVECPLCMEPLEIDDINFFPCTCGYQICRFCWHRIRTDENGLCPACRKQYPEDPAEFKPLTEDELQRIRKERKQKDLQRKQKAAENRKHLANVRVVQKNLVFVVGLSQRLADPEVLKKHDYFGKYGKIHKVVINQSTSYAGAQGPSASAYVTYNKAEDALKAILAVNNVHVDGRTLKASLGTTKYCSHFLRGAQCAKQDCMYLHELGEEAASFTKEEMQMGKHQEYEQKLLETFMNSVNSQNTANNITSTQNNKNTLTRKKNTSPITVNQTSQQQQNSPQHTPPEKPTDSSPPNSITHTMAPPHTSNKDAWPSLHIGQNKTEPVPNNNRLNHMTNHKTDTAHNKAPGHHKSRTKTDTDHTENSITQNLPDRTDIINRSDGRTISPPQISQISQTTTAPSLVTQTKTLPHSSTLPARLAGAGIKPGMVFENPAQSLSLFSGNGFHGNRNQKIPVPTQTELPETIPATEISESIPVSSCTDWQAAFGFASKTRETQDDDLGFDPWDESSKGLADLLEKESYNFQSQNRYLGNMPNNRLGNIPQNLPPGFSLSQIQQQQQQQHTQHPAFLRQDFQGSRIMNFTQPPPMQNNFHDEQKISSDSNAHQRDSFSMKDWQDGLRALLPNINISFGAPPHLGSNSGLPGTQPNSTHSQTHKNTALSDSPPHWLKSIHQLTELESQGQNNHRLPFVQQFPIRNTGWPAQTHNPPPGFQTPIRPPTQPPQPHKITEGLQ